MSGCCDIYVVFREVCVIYFHFHKKVKPVSPLFSIVFLFFFSKYSIPIRLTVVLSGLISHFEFFFLILSSFPSSSINNTGCCCWLIEIDFYSASILLALFEKTQSPGRSYLDNCHQDNEERPTSFITLFWFLFATFWVADQILSLGIFFLLNY